MVKNLPAMKMTQVRSLGQEDLLEEGLATHSSILAWRTEPGGLQSIGLQRVGHDWATEDTGMRAPVSGTAPSKAEHALKPCT